ncbi:MAG: AIR synthase [Lachnospiraceae bacterium]
MRRIERENTGLMKPGQDLVVAGEIGQVGTQTIISCKQEELLTRFTRDYLDRAFQEKRIEAEDDPGLWEQLGVTEYEPVEEGGILTALWNLSGAYEMGVQFTLQQIPVSQVTIEVCEFYGLNPYRLMSGNCVLLTVPNGGQAVQALQEMGISAAVIGRVNRGIKRTILSEDGVGYLDRPQKDELEKVVPQYFQNI